jgi:bifunctional oligoribonuclease and PAP phosphatase NrnA
MIINRFKEELLKFRNKTVGVISHIRPDADCIGSQVALCRWLEKNGIKPQAFNDDNLNTNIQWLSKHYPIQQTSIKKVRACDAYIFVDGNHPDRFGIAGEIAEKSKSKLFMIDHHPDPATIFDATLWDVKASSTCELIYRLYAQDLTQLDLPAAEALYAGIMTDTGSFRFDNVGYRTHRAVAKMMQITGLETEPIHKRIYDDKNLKHIRLLALVLGTIELHLDNQIASLTVTQKLLEETGCGYHDLEGMVNYGLSISGVKAAVIFFEMNNKIKLSFRSNSDIDVNSWARQFNGGGHLKASGGWFEGSMNEAKKRVLSEGRSQLNKL